MNSILNDKISFFVLFVSWTNFILFIKTIPAYDPNIAIKLYIGPEINCPGKNTRSEIKLIIPDIKEYRERLYSYSSSLTWDKYN